ncbi:MAG: toprim domain-containing protein [Flavobacteriales bacterium]
MVIENTGQYRGVYHVLGGKISPINGVGLTKLNITTLLEKLKQGGVTKVIIAMSNTIEGDTTIFYIYKQINGTSIKLSTIIS